MAHFKRKRPRTAVSRGYSDNHLKRRLSPADFALYWGGGWSERCPSWWQILFHSRPHRRKTAAMERKVLAGEDFDNMAWPVYGKPYKYYY